MIDTEEIDITSAEEGVISSKAVEHMVDNLALDELYSLRFTDVRFVLKDLLRQVQTYGTYRAAQVTQRQVLVFIF